MRSSVSIAAAAAAGAAAAVLAGDILVQPVSVSAPGEAEARFVHTIDGSGLSFPLAKDAPAPASAIDLPCHETAGRPGNSPSIETIAGRFHKSAGGVVTYDLGRVCEVTGVVIWNYNEFWQDAWYNKRAVSNALVEVAASMTGEFRRVETIVIPKPPRSDWTEPSIIPLTNGPVRARAIRLLNFIGKDAPMYYGFGEIRFQARPSP